MDITTVFGTVILGSNPGGGTIVKNNPSGVCFCLQLPSARIRSRLEQPALGEIILNVSEEPRMIGGRGILARIKYLVIPGTNLDSKCFVSATTEGSEQ